jgi:photosystem II stability/assembly factor-like uncharacterized protein
VTGASDIGSLVTTTVPRSNDGVASNDAPGAGRVRLSPSNPDNRIFLVMNDSLPYLSTDGGGTWARVVVADVGFQRLAFTDVAEKPGSSALVLASGNKGIYRSVNGGASFSRLNATGLGEHALAAMVYHSNNVAFAGDHAGQLYCSVDDGSTWQAVSGNLGASIRDMKFMNGAIHVLTDGAGVWKKDGVCP